MPDCRFSRFESPNGGEIGVDEIVDQINVNLKSSLFFTAESISSISNIITTYNTTTTLV